MPTFNTLTPITTMDGHPLKDGAIDSPQDRAEINAMRLAYASAPEAQRPLIDMKLSALTESMQKDLTVGRAVISSLVNALKGDDEMPANSKLDNFMLAMRIRAATDMVDINHTEHENIKSRVALAYPSALVVGQILAAIVEKPSAS